MPERLSRLLHPAFLVALATLVVNDHVLKDAFGNALTGKLSDVAGLVVLPVLASSLFGLARRRAVWSVHVAVGLAFAVVQFVPAEIVAAVLGVRHTPDPTDLVALAILPVGVWLSLAAPRQLVVAPRLRPAFAHAIGLVAVGAVLATAPPLPQPITSSTVARAQTAPEALERLEYAFFVQGLDAERCEPAPFEEWSAPTPEIAARRNTDNDSLWTSAYALVVREWEAALAAGHAEYAVPFSAERSGLAEDLRVGLVTRWDSASRRFYVEAWGNGMCRLDGTFGRGIAPFSAEEPKAARRAIERRLLRPLRDAAGQ